MSRSAAVYLASILAGVTAIAELWVLIFNLKVVASWFALGFVLWNLLPCAVALWIATRARNPLLSLGISVPYAFVYAWIFHYNFVESNGLYAGHLYVWGHMYVIFFGVIGLLIAIPTKYLIRNEHPDA